MMRQIEYPEVENLRAAIRATLADGGGTFRAGTFESVSPARGYAVATRGCTVRADAKPYRLRAALRTIAVGSDYVGTWRHDGRVYVDAVSIIEDHDAAITLAQRHNQLAIYDFAAHAEIGIAA